MATTLLIGLDGATFTILDPLMGRGVMPFLRDLAARGVRAPLRSVVPALTPPAWTSLATGKRPGHHGVFDFLQKEAPQSHYFRLATSQDVGSATIWSLASEEGRRVIALNFPLMFPPPAVNGCVVPGGWMPWRQLRLGCHPPGLFDRLKALPSFNARELALDMALEEKALEGCATEEYADWVALHVRRERRWFDVARYLMQHEPADLVGLVFDGVDKLQHLCWRFLDPACQPAQPLPWEQEIARACESYFRQLDELIAGLVELAGPDATVVLASDHGFGPLTEVFYLNTWLEQQGYLRWASAAVPTTSLPRLGFGHMARHIHELDWEHTVAYAATPSSHGIHLVVEPPGNGRRLAPEAYRRIRAELAQALLRACHPASGEPLVGQVGTREELFSGPYEAMAPDLSVLPREGSVISILRADTVVQPRVEPAGTHRPEGIFLASGPGIRAGEALAELAIVDVAPLLLHSLGLPLPDDLDGRLPAEVFEAAALRRRPPRAVASRPPAPARPSAGLDGEDEAEILRRLRALGYVE